MKRPALLRIRPVVAPASTRVDAAALDAHLAGLGEAGRVARDLDREVADALGGLASLSELTARLALDYVDRLARLVHALTPELGVHAVSRAYAAHVLVERDPARYGAGEITVLALPDPHRGRPPQDLLTRVVKASRRGFPARCCLPPPVWDGFARAVVLHVHEGAPDPGGLVAPEVVEDLARVGWLLRQVDLRYGLHHLSP